MIFDERIHGFLVKPHAIYYSSFLKVLLLDADNFAIRDPTFLFESAEFKRYGAILWPDFWHPGNTIFNVHAQSLLWEVLGIPPVDSLEQESGQLVIDRVQSRHALERVLFLATHRPRVLHKLGLVWGNKDLFRLAWLSLQQPFILNDHRLPGALGIIQSSRRRFCGLSMVYYDFKTNAILFVHRNTIKFTGDRVRDSKKWRMLQEYEPAAVRTAKILSFNGAKLFNETSCFGIKRYDSNVAEGVVQMRSTDNIDDLASLEDRIQEYAEEVVNIK